MRGDPRTVEVSGELASLGHASPGSALVDIEYSRDGTGTWDRKATLSAPYGFNGEIRASRPGYWRAHYRGDIQFKPAISEAVYVDPR